MLSSRGLGAAEARPTTRAGTVRMVRSRLPTTWPSIGEAVITGVAEVQLMEIAPMVVMLGGLSLRALVLPAS